MKFKKIMLASLLGVTTLLAGVIVPTVASAAATSKPIIVGSKNLS